MKTRFHKYRNFFDNKHILQFFILIFAFSLHGQQLSLDYLSYIETYKEIAVRQQQEYGIPASITLAQGLLESGAGRSRLASEGNNHFGIKCHKDWKGGGIYQDDDEENECFRRYSDAEESFEDHARFLKRKRYEPLFALEETDYAAWAKGLKKCGYATDPSYPSKLINIIERYKLYDFDSGQPVVAHRKYLKGDESLEHSIDMEIVSEFRIMHVIIQRWGLYCVKVYDGDSYDSLADEFGMKKKKLLGYNDLGKKDVMLPAGSLLYLQEKHKAMPADGPQICLARKGDTPYAVAQRYGIKLDSFLKINKLRRDSKLEDGQKLRLR